MPDTTRGEIPLKAKPLKTGELLELSPGQIVGDSYRIHSKIGIGAMGVVYRGEDIRLQRPVALKFLNPVIADSPEVVNLFRAEARALASMDHPNIVKVFTFGEEQGCLYFAMELIGGKALSSRIDDESRFRAGGAAPILRQIAEALEASHSGGMYHRDLKPANVMILPGDKVKVMDFGLAGVAAEATGRAVGTPRYMAPEQALGLKIDGRADLYSLGIIAYEMLVGDVPFEGENYRKTLEMQVHSPVPSPRSRKPDIPGEWDQFVRELLAKKPEERPSSAYEVIRKIDNLMAGESGSTGRGIAPDPAAEAERIYQKARAHFDIGEFNQARGLLKEVLFRNETHSKGWNLLGAIELKNDNHTEAGKAFAKALTSDSDFFEATLNLGVALQKQKRHAEAIWAFERSIKLMPGLPSSWRHLGEARLAMRDLPGTRNAWERAIELDPANSKLKERLIELKKAMAL